MKDRTFLRPLIFYAEDSFVQSRLFSLALEETKPDFDVQYFQNGEFLLEGLRKRSRDKLPFPKIILLDLEMPILNGFETLELLREEEIFDGIQILVFSSVIDDWMGKELIQMGANGYIRKPVLLDELIAIVNYLDEYIMERMLNP